MGKKIGIDLGTTYSCVSYVDDAGVVRIIEPSDGIGHKTPSVVYFEPGTNEVVVGSTARDEGTMNPECVVERIKSYMGEKDYTVNINGHDYSPVAISSLILRKLINDAEARLGEGEIDGAIITCPAYFGDAARDAIKLACNNVVMSNGQKLNVLQVLDEPFAAAISYCHSYQEDMQKTVLVYDLGGATFDATVMKINYMGDNQKLEVITADGDHKLGGKDWDAALADYVRNKFCELTGCDSDEILNDLESNLWYSENIEKAKIKLTQKESVRVVPRFNGIKEQIEVTRDIFEAETEYLLNQTIQLIEAMMSKKGLSVANDIDEILLVGGSTRMPQVEKRLQQEYNKPIRKHEPDTDVAMGAALFANQFQTYALNPPHSDYGQANNSIGIEMRHRGYNSAFTLVRRLDVTPRIVSTKELLHIKLGDEYDPSKEIVATLYKYASDCDSEQIQKCFECAKVIFSNPWHLKIGSDIWFDLECNDGFGDKSDFLTIHYGEENLTEKKKVHWKKMGTIM